LGPELRALGVEKPEQLGAMFMMDSALLREWTQNASPLEDNFPKRITDHYTVTPEGQRELFLAMDGHQRRVDFERSSLIQESWPRSLRDSSLRYFAFQAAIDRFGPVTRGEGALRDFTRVLTQSDLRTPILWMLGSGEHEQEILSRVMSQSESITEEMRYHLGAGALADRDYLEAEAHFAKIQDPASQYVNTSFLRVFALYMQGDLGRAEELARELVSSDPLPTACYQWLKETFGLAAPQASGS
jgi:hypothetical protein